MRKKLIMILIIAALVHFLVNGKLKWLWHQFLTLHEVSDLTICVVSVISLLIYLQMFILCGRYLSASPQDWWRVHALLQDDKTQTGVPI